MTKKKSKQKSIAFGKPYFHALKGGLSGKAIEQAVCTSQSTVFLTSEGKIYQTGTLHGQVYESPTIVEIKYALKCVEISAGRHFCLGRLEGGQAVLSWGAGHFGQLGLGGDKMVSFTSTPTIIERLLPRHIGSPVKQIAAGSWHALALAESGKVWAWGSNRNWQCGRQLTSKSQTDAPTFTVPLPVPQLEGVAQISAGRAHSVALIAQSGEVYCWGASHHGQCATSTRRGVSGVAPPKLVQTLQDVLVTKVVAGGNHTLCLTSGGRVFSWGAGGEGQLGLGVAVPYQTKPRLIGDLDFVAIAAGQDWKLQQRGASAKSLASVPKIRDIYAGPAYSIATSTSGHVYVWGSNDAGQLGIHAPSNLPFLDVGQETRHQGGSLRDMHVRTFDSDHNILLPHRLIASELLDVTLVACGPNHLWCIGEERSESNAAAPGRTLYELQEQVREERLVRVRQSLMAKAESAQTPLRDNAVGVDLSIEDTDSHESLAMSPAAESISELAIEDSTEHTSDKSATAEDDDTVTETSASPRWSLTNLIRRMSTGNSVGSNSPRKPRRSFLRNPSM